MTAAAPAMITRAPELKLPEKAAPTPLRLPPPEISNDTGVKEAKTFVQWCLGKQRGPKPRAPRSVNFVVLDTWPSTRKQHRATTLEDSLRSLGWASVSKALTRPLSTPLANSGLPELAARIFETRKWVLPDDALGGLDPEPFRAQHAQVEDALNAVEGPWVWVGDDVCLALHLVLGALPGPEAANTVLVFLRDDGVGAHFAKLEWAPGMMIHTRVVHQWSQWQFDRWQGRKFELVFNGQRAEKILTSKTQRTSGSAGRGQARTADQCGTAQRPGLGSREDDQEKALVEARVRARKIPVLFLHIHKAGGSTMCNVAKENRLAVPAVYSPSSYSGIAGKNCNPSPQHIAMAWSGSAGDQALYAHAMGHDLFAHEKYLPAELAFGEMAFLGILRHPFDRYLSGGKHTGFKCIPKYDRRTKQLTKTRGKDFHEYVQCGEDNFMVRRICGCLGSPKAEVCGDHSPDALHESEFRKIPMTRKHLECAKARLDRFSVVLVTEMMDQAPAILSAKFGWSVTSMESLRGGTASGSNALQEFKNEPHTVKALAERHELDLELYKHAVTLMCRQLAELESAREA